MTNFLEKWSSRKANKPKAGSKTVIDTFRARVAEQKAFLEEYERDTAGFRKWRSTWFQRVPGGFGVTIGRDSINAGNGLNYVVVETLKDVAEFLDDLAHHAENDASFQHALEENRKRRATLLTAAKTGSAPAATKAATKPAAAKPARAKATTAVAEAGEKPKRSRKPKAENAAE